MKILILGTSVRSLMASANAAGVDVVGLDSFADWDACRLGKMATTAACSVRMLDASSGNIPEVALGNFDGVIISGGLENRIQWVQRLEQRIRILGPSAECLIAMQDTIGIMGELNCAGFCIPKTKRMLCSTDRPHEWLRKTEGTSGGSGVTVATHADSETNRKQTVYQARIKGEVYSAVFVSSILEETGGRCSSTRLVGVSRQLIGFRHWGAGPFGYCGSIGPVSGSLSNGSLDLGPVEKIGTAIGESTNVLGVWGMDFISNKEGIWPVDFNPRITASAELFELALRRSPAGLSGVVDLHIKACQGRLNPVWERISYAGCGSGKDERVEGKAVLFNRSNAPLMIGERLAKKLRAMYDPEFVDDPTASFSLFDIPQTGTVVPIRGPVLTIRVRCETSSDVLNELEQDSMLVYGMIGDKR